MSWKARVLVVANKTADSDELSAALHERARESEVELTLLVPATPLTPGMAHGRAAAERQMTMTVNRLRRAGLQIDGLVGDPDPVIAVAEALDSARFDEVIVSTLPASLSRWLQEGLPERVAKLTRARVTHVLGSEAGVTVG